MILACERLCFAYGASPVLENVSVRIGPGITGIIGPNAAGKSTLLKCLCGMLKARGQVLLDGRALRDFKRQEVTRLLSHLPQNLSTQAALTVFEAVLIGRVHQLGWRVTERDTAVVERLLRDMDLCGLADRYVNELSGGQLQLVATAQALAREPAVLLMDEPTSNLDVRRQLETCAVVAEMTASRRISTAIALHDLNIAARFADTIYVLQGGSVRCSGTPAAVLTERMIASVYGVAARVATDDQGRPLVTPLGLTPQAL